jgi:hypothetical protein
MLRSFRQLAALADTLRLDSDRARVSYEDARRYASHERYGLDSATVRSIERHRIDSISVAVHWVSDRVPNTGSVRVVFGPNEVFVARTGFFLEQWPHLFAPGRDDVIVLSDEDDWVLSYCHEEELEYGRPAK